MLGSIRKHKARCYFVGRMNARNTCLGRVTLILSANTTTNGRPRGFWNFGL